MKASVKDAEWFSLEELEASRDEYLAEQEKEHPSKEVRSLLTWPFSSIHNVILIYGCWNRSSFAMPSLLRKAENVMTSIEALDCSKVRLYLAAFMMASPYLLKVTHLNST